ncbi:MAG: N-acetylglucosamine-6-phosphate deacetylase [Acidobacteriaceae bacterium]|nr:N-acetylglucosamine-6-phosphate deacetylase [Acidobacteriaceae bacterium]
MPSSTLSARFLLTEDRVLEHPVLTLDSAGLIESIHSDPSAPHQNDTLTAASLEIHTHGALGHDVMSASLSEMGEVQRYFARHGVAHYLPTTVTDSIENTLRALDKLATLIESPTPQEQATPVGIHLEGPFLSHARRGVHPAHELQQPTLELFRRFWEASRGHIQLMTLAPELPGALELLDSTRALGLRVTLGHSNATFAETEAAIAHGAASVTHTFNAMRALDHREPGILGAALTNPNLYADLIADGVHVAPAAVRLWWNAKRNARAILITDSMSATGMPDGAYSLGGLNVTVRGNRAALTDAPETLAGSVLTLDAAIENLQRFTDASLAEATAAASHTPAAMLGRPELTALRAGAPAHLNRYDAQGRRTQSYLFGRLL